MDPFLPIVPFLLYPFIHFFQLRKLTKTRYFLLLNINKLLRLRVRVPLQPLPHGDTG